MAAVLLLAVRGLAQNTDAAFRRELVALCRRQKCDPSYVAAVMSFETGGTFSPSVRNPLSHFVGLIQFGPDAARILGTTMDELAAMSAIAQLAYVEKYFARWAGRLHTVSDHYLAVFAPAGIGHDGSFVLYASPSAAYTQNRGLDRSGDGTITNSEAVAPVEGIVARARQELPIPVTDQAEAPSSSSSPSQGLLGLGLAALIALLARLKGRT